MLFAKYKLNNTIVEQEFASADELMSKIVNEDINLIEIRYPNSIAVVTIPEDAEFQSRLKLDAELFYVNEVKTYDKPHGAKLSHAQLNQFFTSEAPKYDSLEQVETALKNLYKRSGIETTGQGLKQVISNYKKRVDLSKQSQKRVVKESTLSAEELKKREAIVKSMKKNFKAFKRKYGDDAKSVIYATATTIAKKD